MTRIIRTLAACIAIIAATLTAYSAIDLSAPEVKPAQTINAARITQISVQFYTDGANLAACRCFVAWDKGNAADGAFSVITTDNMVIPAADFAGILKAAEVATPTEYLLGSEANKTPMDKIFPALVGYLKAKGKL